MLSELERLHGNLLELMTTMRGLVALDAPPFDEVSATRLKLSKASSARARYLADAVYPWLLARVDQAKAREVCLLRESGALDRARSSNHVARWSGTAVAADWAGYRRDGRLILQMMAERIGREKALLYPLLLATERRAGTAAR